MFYNQGGKEILVGEGYICHLPPVPEKHLIIGYNQPRSEQYWKRQQVPDHYHKLFKEEAERQAEDKILVSQGKKSKVFIDQQLERYRRQEWQRRIWGCWFMNDGEPTYLTNHHYWYLQFCKFDHKENDGYPLFYEFSRDNFYIRQWCEVNPFSLGYLMIGPRGTGKSNEEIACYTNRATYFHDHIVSIQGKHEDDATDFIKNKIAPLFNALPSFFKPEYSHGIHPKNELIFTRPSTSGKAVKELQFGPDFELGSTIMANQPGEKVLDRTRRGDVHNTEVGKTDPAVADIYERHLVQVRVVVRNHRKVGILRDESTVELMKEGGRECHKLWKASNPKILDGNGWTRSKIHRHLDSALDTDTSLDPFETDGVKYPAPCNKYGKVDRRLANIRIEADLASVRHDLQELSARMRKSPRNEAEAFIPDQSKSIFNIEKLTTRLNKIRNEMPRPPYSRGNFYWVKERFGPVWWAPDDHAGRFNCAWMPDEFHLCIKEPGKNKIINNWKKEWGYDREGNARELIVPGNDGLFRAATDPIKYSFTKDPRASKAAIHAFRLYDHLIDGGRPRSQWKTHNFIFEYCVRPENPATYWEDMAMMCMFLGCKVFPEKNIPDINAFFEKNGLQNLLSYPKDWIASDVLEIIDAKSDDAGAASSKPVIDYYTKRLIPFINDDIDRMPFDDTIEDWSMFDPLEPTKSHLTVSSGFALIHAEKVVEAERPVESKLSDWFDQADNSGMTGILIESKD